MNQTEANGRSLLRAELEKRCAKNPRYSLRAFAKSLGISHTILSLVLSGRRPISKKFSVQIAEALSLSPAERSQIASRREAANEDGNFQKMELEVFSLISNWYHYAILSLLEIPGAQWKASWIAKILQIRVVEAKFAMERLLSLGLVTPNRRGEYKQTDKPMKVENTFSTAATRKFHKDLLARAEQSLESDPFEERDFSSMTFAMDPKNIAYAKERIRKFRRELMAELESRGAPKRVYHLSVQLFPISKDFLSSQKRGES